MDDELEEDEETVVVVDVTEEDTSGEKVDNLE